MRFRLDMPATISTPAPAAEDFYEAPAWAAVRAGWQRLYGSFATIGVSIEAHDFRCRSEINWARSFHPDSLELCLNLAGRGDVAVKANRADYAARTIGHYAIVDAKISARRRQNERHLFLTIELSP